LQKETTANTDKIESNKSTVDATRAKLSSHPNPSSHVRMNEMIAAREAEVLQAWSSVYDRQRHLLTWPEGDLTPEFINEFKDLIPIEQYIEFPTPQEKEKQTVYLTQYAYYIGLSLPAVAKICNAEWTAVFDPAAGKGGGGGGEMGMGMGMEMSMGMGMGMEMNMGTAGANQDDGPLVKWSQASQDALLADLFPWRARKRPTTLEVYYSQENIWILKSILGVINTVNGDAKQSFQAKIREINGINIGRSVKFTAGSITSPGSSSQGTGGMDYMDMGMGGMDSMGMDSMGMDDMDMGMGMGGMGGGVATVSVDPGDNRYVDTDNKPITGSALRSALTSYSPTDASIAVAKRVPVKMSVRIDQRAVTDLIAACGSAPLMIDVQQVRILPKNSSGATMGGEMGMGMGMGMDSDMGMGMDMGMGGMSGMGMGGMAMGAAPTAVPQDEYPFDMNVEVYGLIYVYNPPQKDKLGVKDVTADTVINGETLTEGSDTENAAVVPQVVPAPTEGALPAPNAEGASPAVPDAAAAPLAGVPTPPTAIAAPASN
jgi:hypothetical protein